MSNGHHHMGGCQGTVAWLVVFLIFFLFLGGPIMSGCAKLLNHLPGSTAEEPIE